MATGLSRRMNPHCGTGSRAVKGEGWVSSRTSGRAIRIWRRRVHWRWPFDKLGVDMLELGAPFSDTLTDGLVNQLAAQGYTANSRNLFAIFGPMPSSSCL